MSTMAELDSEVDEHPMLGASRAYCARVTREQARNFYYGLKLLPEPKRSAMFALYAYMRLTDDIADDGDGRSVAQRRSDLDEWHRRTAEAVAGQLSDSAVEAGDVNPEQLIWPSLADVVGRYSVSPALLYDAIAGQRQDLDGATIRSFDDLREYCRQVAGVVGQASLHIWGFEGGAETEQMAIDRGVAFQLTNILRDLREDAANGRCYLPADELAAAGVHSADLCAETPSQAFLDLMRFQIDRARDYYERSSPLEGRISADSRPTLVAMTAIYRGLLDKIAKDPARVLYERVSLSLLTKLRIGWRAAKSR